MHVEDEARNRIVVYDARMNERRLTLREAAFIFVSFGKSKIFCKPNIQKLMKEKCLCSVDSNTFITICGALLSNSLCTK